MGAAVGLGNALRFPGLCAKYGGGAFLIVYAAALAALGIPLLCAEIALGRKVRDGAPACMGSLVRGGEKLGWAQCANSAFTAVIYSGLAGWIAAQGLSSFKLCLSEEYRARASEFFFSEVLKAGGDGVISGISPLVSVCICLVWAAMFFCLKKGAKSLSGAARITVFAPMIFLSALAVRGLMYANSGEALSALFTPDFSAFSSPAMWADALGQVFFSLSLAVGIMPAFGACLPEKSRIFPSALVIAAADVSVSLISSVALFTTMYGCGLRGAVSDSGILTAFSAYPAAIANLFPDRYLCGAAGALFYMSLAMMAVQSGASMLEAALSPLISRFGLSRGKTAGVACALLGASSLVYATTAGDVIVAVGDRFVNLYNVATLCAAECIFFALKGGGLAGEVNRYCSRLKAPERFFGLSLRVLCPAVTVFFALTQWAGFFSSGAGGAPPWAEFAFGWGLTLSAIAAGFAVKLIKKKA